jgi:MoaA/NifB/PqqE/SkfB family radical SAM enzyme
MAEIKPQEINNRNKLKENKPLVYEKVIKYNMPRIQFQARYNCNFSCQHCSINGVKDKSRKTLSIADIKNIFDQADVMGISRMTLSGGEPLIFPDLDQIIEAIGAKRFWIQLDTNAYLLTEEKIQHLKEIGIDCIAPSLDSLNKNGHDLFRNTKGSAEKVFKAVDMIQKAGLNIFIQTVVTHNRLHSNEFINFIKYFNDKEIGVFVSFAKPVGAFSNNFDELITKNDLVYMEKLEKKYKVFTHLTPAYGINEERYCVASKNIFGLTEYGDILPCIYFYCSMGNVLEEPLKDIYDRCIRLKPFKKQTCVLADKSNDFIEKYLVKKIYGKKLPVPYKEVFTEEDFE